MIDNYYWILKDNKPISTNDIHEWAKFIENPKNKIVKRDELPNGVLVSTVFLGIDHGWEEKEPILFETMIFGGEQDQYCERYATWEQAEAGHQRAIELVFS